MATDVNRCQIFPGVQGFENRQNDIIYYPSYSGNQPCPSRENKDSDVIVYFGGDIQDYREKMEKHRDNKRYAEGRNLEITAAMLSKKISVFVDSRHQISTNVFRIVRLLFEFLTVQ